MNAQALNLYFDGVADMIPAQFYVTEQTDREEEEISNKYKKGLNSESKMAKKAKNKQKKAEKFASPENASSLKVKQRKWDEMRAEEEEVEEEDEEGEGDSSDDNLVASHVSDEDDETTTNDTVDTASTVTSEAVEAIPGESRIEALRRKLNAKIEAKKNRPANGANPSGVSKRAARKAAKKERQEAAKRKAKGGFSNAERAKSSGSFSGAATGGPNDQVDPNSPPPSTSNLADDLSGIDFGGISGLKKKKYFQDNKSLANQGKKKSLESMLSEAEEKKRRLKELKGSSNPEDKEKAKRILWGDTLKAADGEIIRDDPEKIKKAMKKKEKKKAKSAKQWEDRITTVADSMLEKQRIRKHNLDKRKLGGTEAANLSSKRIAEDDDAKGEGGSKGKKQRMGPHSGKGRDGFEGRKGDFITSGGGSSSGKGGKGKNAGTGQ
ncbi:hypothetical protein TrCOL_g3780 [Triparma columacea]|uniref:Ribosomal RNA-processing protein 14/surfeit locus protein 6 C-terminal domain-containing protein n=1 Tax=Triparma columacea TaxID=722753 RepID=A0A9W7L638_9STRA|nr:hypothetical protein TrCOL_g3780 [Triparma columacea]